VVDYIIEQPSILREPEAMRRLLRTPGLAESLFARLGLSALSWLVIELPTSELAGIKGEIDIIGGRLAFQDITYFERLTQEHESLRPDWNPSWHPYMAAKQIAEEGGLVWPPSADYLVGLEVECAYFDGERIRSDKSSRGNVANILKQIERMVDLGLDRIALLDVIANHPQDGEGSSAWLNAAGRSHTSLLAMKPVLSARLPKIHVSGHWVWPVGAVVGGSESRRGAGAPTELREALPNPKSSSQKRSEFGSSLKAALAEAPSPTHFPWVLEHCQACAKIHRFDVCLTS
jgi:hypothetical protein